MSRVILLAADRPLPLMEPAFRRIRRTGRFVVETDGFSVRPHEYYRGAVDELELELKPIQYELNLQATQEQMEGLRAYLADNARYIADFLADWLPQVRYRIPEGTYLAWLDFRALGLTPEALWERMLHRARVATDNGVLFGPEGEGDGFQRLNFACPRSQLTEALTRIAGAFASR